MKKLAIAFAAAALSAHSYGASQPLFTAFSAVYKPLIERKDTGYASCGIGAVVMAPGRDQKYAAEYYDLSLAVYASPLGAMAKIGRGDVSRSDLATTSVKGVSKTPPKSFWFAKASSQKRVSMLKTMKSDNQGFLLGVAEVTSAFDLLMAMVNGEQVQLAVDAPGYEIGRIVQFSSKLGDQEYMALSECINGFMDTVSNNEPKEDHTQ